MGRGRWQCSSGKQRKKKGVLCTIAGTSVENGTRAHLAFGIVMQRGEKRRKKGVCHLWSIPTIYFGSREKEKRKSRAPGRTFHNKKGEGGKESYYYLRRS